MVIYYFFLLSFFFLREIKFVDGRKTRKDEHPVPLFGRSIVREARRIRRVAANAANLGFIFGFFGGFNSPSRSTASPQWRSPRLKRQLKTRTGMKIIERVEWQWLPRLKEQYPSVAGKQVDGGLGQRIELEKIEGMCTCTQRVHRAQCVFRTIPKAPVVSGF